jgi:hypothetical protein
MYTDNSQAYTMYPTIDEIDLIGPTRNGDWKSRDALHDEPIYTPLKIVNQKSKTHTHHTTQIDQPRFYLIDVRYVRRAS